MHNEIATNEWTDRREVPIWTLRGESDTGCCGTLYLFVVVVAILMDATPRVVLAKDKVCTTLFMVAWRWMSRIGAFI